MGREALASAVPAERKKPVRERLKLGESTVRQYVRRRKRELGLVARATFIPQSYAWGDEGQVDGYEAWAELGGEAEKVCIFCMRSMASGAAFHRAYPHASRQAFLEAHELAFAYFGGVFHRQRYDNLKSAVKKILRGHQREETERFVAFRSHWGFESEFCNPARGNEKGGVEGEGGQFRRNHLVPLPAAVSFPTVNSSGCANVLTNFYSVPLPVGTRVEAKVQAAYVEVWHEGRRVARHEVAAAT